MLRLGLLLSTPPEHPNLGTVCGLIDAALIQKQGVYLYLIDEGVKAILDPEISRLKKRGLKLFACAYGAVRYEIEINEEAVFGGLVVLSDLMKGCDRFVCF